VQSPHVLLCSVWCSERDCPDSPVDKDLPIHGPWQDHIVLCWLRGDSSCGLQRKACGRTSKGGQVQACTSYRLARKSCRVPLAPSPRWLRAAAKLCAPSTIPCSGAQHSKLQQPTCSSECVPGLQMPLQCPPPAHAVSTAQHSTAGLSCAARQSWRSSETFQAGQSKTCWLQAAGQGECGGGRTHHHLTTPPLCQHSWTRPPAALGWHASGG
jgi:hypothetical protein